MRCGYQQRSRQDLCAVLRNCSRLLSFTQKGLQESCIGDIGFVERKDISPANARAKRGTGIIGSASPAPARKENQGLSITSISTHHRGEKVGTFKWLSRVIIKSF